MSTTSRSTESNSATVRDDRIPIWDPLVRTVHWLLVAGFALAYLTGEEEGGGPDTIHVWSGYAVAVLVAARIVWGFAGPRRARFSDFVYSPVAAVRYLSDLVRGRAKRYLGHSPAGGLMVILLLAFLAGTVVTGLVAYGERGSGPLAGMVSMSPPASSVVREENEHQSRSGRGEKGESGVGGLHAALANATLDLIVLHLLGVGLASIVHRENLVAAMIHGRKRGLSRNARTT